MLAANASTIKSDSTNSDDTGRILLDRDEFHHWQRYVRGFRREHNFTFSAGVSVGNWEIRHFGTMKSKKFSNSGIFSKGQYSFHLPFVDRIGYLLGSSFGYHYETTDKRRPYKSVPAVMFPGLLAGLSVNFTPAIRWIIAGEVYLERHDGIEERDKIEKDTKISITFHSYDINTAIDIFYKLNWALRIVTHYRQLRYFQPLNTSEKAVDANLNKTDRWLGFGLVFHLL